MRKKRTRKSVSQIAIAAAQRRRETGISAEEAARRSGIGADIIRHADKLLDDPETVARVERGEVRVMAITHPAGTTVRVPPDLHERLLALRQLTGRPLHDLVRDAVASYLAVAERAAVVASAVAAAPPPVPADRRGTRACEHCSAGDGQPHHRDCPRGGRFALVPPGAICPSCSTSLTGERVEHHPDCARTSTPTAN